jgi:CRISPR/Cas system-associated exonuclease Cas4 (RecB family)
VFAARPGDGFVAAGIAEDSEQTPMKAAKRAGRLRGVRHFDVLIVSHQHRLVGRLDEMVETTDGYLVDYKDTDRDYGYWRRKLAYKLAGRGGYRALDAHIHHSRSTVHAVQFRPSDTAKLKGILEALHQMIEAEVCPPPVDQLGKCRSCQYARFCNDVF